MKKKTFKIIAGILGVLVVLWSAMLITDITRSNDFQKPVFAWEKDVQPDDGSVLYQGLGYTVNTRHYTDENGETYPEYSEVKLFGILVSAVIV